MCRTSLRKRLLPAAQRLCGADLRRGAVQPAGRAARRPRRAHRLGRVGPRRRGRRAAGGALLLRPLVVMSTRAVTSLTNPTVKAVRALHLKKARDESGLFVAEGLKTVTEGVELGQAPRTLLFGREAAAHPLLKQALSATLAAGGEALEVT